MQLKDSNVDLRDGSKWKPTINDHTKEVTNIPRYDQLSKGSDFAINQC